MFEEYLGKQVLVIEPSGEDTVGVLKEILYDSKKNVIGIKLSTFRADVVIPFPFKLKREVSEVWILGTFLKNLKILQMKTFG